jgi:hypothetical protein
MTDCAGGQNVGLTASKRWNPLLTRKRSPISAPCHDFRQIERLSLPGPRGTICITFGSLSGLGKKEAATERSLDQLSDDALRTPNETGNGGRIGPFWAAWPSLSYPMNCGP